MSLITADLLASLRSSSDAPHGRKWSEQRGAIGAGIAESDFGTAPAVRDALLGAVGEGLLTYLPDELSERAALACADLYRTRFGWPVDVDWVRGTPDVLSALLGALSVFPQNTPVIVPTPCYAPFLTVPAILGREVLQVPMGATGMDLDRLEETMAAAPGAVLILCNPHNPLGSVLDRETLVQVASIVDRHGGSVFADEIHAPLVFAGREHVPYSSVSPEAAAHAITAISPSKGWNTPGLKAAHAILPSAEYRARWDARGRYPVRGGSPLGAIGIVAAYGDSGQAWLADLLARLDENRRLLGGLLAERLPRVSYREPEATYLAWLGFGEHELPTNPATFFLERCGVATVSGADCGRSGEQFLRFNFATEADVIERAIDRMATALG